MYNVYKYACRAGVQFVHAACDAGKSSELCESFHGHPDHDEVGPDEVVIDPAAVTLSRSESQLLRSSGEIPKLVFYSTSTVK